MRWKYVNLGDVCKTSAGGTPLKSRKEFYEDGDIPWLMSGEVCSKEIFTSTNFITKAGVENSSAKIFPPNTTLIAMYGATAGQVGILRLHAATNQAVCGILPTDQYLPEFLYYYLSFYKEILLLEATGVAQPNLSQVKIKKVPVPVLPIQEQLKIVSKLDAIFAAIDKASLAADTNAKNAEALFQSYLTNTFQCNRKDWNSGELEQFIDIKHGFAFDGEDFEQSDDQSLPIVLTPGNFTEDGKLYFTTKNTKRLNKIEKISNKFNTGDLVVVMTDLSSKMKILGKPAIINRENVLHNQRIGLIQFKNESLSKPFLYYFLKSKKYIDNIKATSTGAMVRHTAPKRILATSINYPKIETQMEIVSKLDELELITSKLNASQKKKIEELSLLKQACLQKAFDDNLRTANE